MKFNYNLIKNSVKSLGYTWFESGNFNINIVGVRNNPTDKITNKFDDFVTVSYLLDGEPQYHEYKATTDPGIYWSENLLNPNGVAILKPGQYRGAYSIGYHQGKYKALKQAKPLPVYRDGDKDQEFDLIEENIQEGIFGINIHRATKWGESTQIDRWSAGCQVIASNSDFEEFMSLVFKSSKLYGNSFTYTLIESKNIT